MDQITFGFGVEDRLTTLTHGPLPQTGIFILLAEPPYELYDKSVGSMTLYNCIHYKYFAPNPEASFFCLYRLT